METKAILKIRNYIKNEEWHKYLVILPTTQLVERFVKLLFNDEISGALYPQIYTFENFVDKVLAYKKDNSLYISDIYKFELLREIINDGIVSKKLIYLRKNTRYEIIRYIAEVITELKQHNISPLDFTSAVEKLNIPRLNDLAIIYKSYAQELSRRGLKDREDKYYEVLTILEKRQLPFIEEVEFLYADWFVDNIPIQQKILEVLDNLISSSILRTGKYGQTKFSDVRKIVNTAEPQHLANLIFTYQNTKAKLPEVTISSERGVEGEVSLIVPEVIRLLENGKDLSEIAIVSRNPQEYAPYLIEYFSRFNIPLNIQIKSPLHENQLIKAVMYWLNLVSRPLTAFSLSNLISNHYLSEDFMHRDYVLYWSRSKGKLTIDEWIRKWQREVNDLSVDLGDEGYQKVLDILEIIKYSWSNMPVSGYVTDILTEIKNRIFSLNLESKIFLFSENVALEERINISHRDTTALKSLIEVIDNMAKAGSASGRVSTLENIIEEIEDYISYLTYTPVRNIQDGIKVLSPSEIRGLQFSTVFLLGMEENKFPNIIKQNPLLRDSDRLRLREQFFLPLSSDISDREKLLFYLVLLASKSELFLIFSDTNEDGQPNLPSLFIEDVISLLPKNSIDKKYQPKTCKQRLSEHLCHILEVEDIRNSKYYSCYEGCLNSKITNELMLKKMERKVFSISSLNDYAKCPMKYFFVRELGLSEMQGTEEGLSRQDIGTLKHEVLARLMSNINAAKEYKIKIDELVLTILEEVCQEKGFTGEEYPDQWLWELEKKDIARNLTVLLETELNRGTFNPVFLEWKFGFDNPFYLDCNGTKVYLRGQIDRIDTDGEDHYVVYDYKESANISRKDIIGAKELQLPVYIMAVEHLIGEVIGTSYIELKTQKPKHPFYLKDYKNKLGFSYSKNQGYDKAQWLNWLATIRTEIANYIDGISQCRFPPTPNSCLYCQFKDICLYKPSRVRLKEKH